VQGGGLLCRDLDGVATSLLRGRLIGALREASSCFCLQHLDFHKIDLKANLKIVIVSIIKALV